MFRRIIVPALTLMFALVACGRQVTPSTSSSGSVLPGDMLVRFRTVNPMNFSLYRYAIIFNTSGNGQEPYANAYLTSFLNYSFVWIVGAQNGFAVAPTLDQIFPVNNGLAEIAVSVPSQDVTLVTNSNGQNNEFTLQFNRALFYTQAPTSTPTPTGATTVPFPAPTTQGQSIWNINVFTLDANNNILDAGGLNANDTSFTLQVDTTTQVDNTLPFQKAGATALADPSAQISGGEIVSTPGLSNP